MFDAVQQVEGPGEQNPRAAAIFGPDEIAVMRRALDLSWSALAFAHFEDEDEIRVTREELARQILQGAARGERSAPILSGHALGALPPRSAGLRGVIWRNSRYDS